ncbi:winged helix-turn-helix transcriptional regulator [Absicoccus intestinalis]|uniref:Winged helix-turn-helix transcriptional regulator n=1 Tax=Absicoccus intestinalis TaxID=2926319 RepID=A0ABU4WLQ7_9FIRM|nr:winged helix-turn-helix transcriptional regulator [Absicoccus sp. CLA-KB-P134]MDX8416412.1 winged helix-turn-helix transcriptional regulator [Absicoccus sp. CLA-KB-P134]
MSQSERSIMNYIRHALGNHLAIPILWYISHHENATYEQIRGYIIYVTNTDLKQALSELMTYHVLQCEQGGYTFTKDGQALVPVLDEIFQWAETTTEKS